jgi:hypothetical protein
MGKLTDHCNRELAAIGYKRFSEESEVNQRIMYALKEMLQVFEDQELTVNEGHYVLNAFQQLSKFQPMGPLKGTEDEWTAGEVEGHSVNVRFPAVVRNPEGRCFNLAGRIFVEPNGTHTTDMRSVVEITSFPYMPTVEFVDAKPQPRIITKLF